MKLRCLIAAACLGMLHAHIHENYVHATDHGFYGEAHGTQNHVAEDIPHFSDGFGGMAQQHIHVSPKEGTKARECEDKFWSFAESDNLTYQQEEDLRRIRLDDGVHPKNRQTIVPFIYPTPWHEMNPESSIATGGQGSANPHGLPSPSYLTFDRPDQYAMLDRWGFEDALWQYRTPMFPKLCTDVCPEQEEIRCRADQCFVRTNYCCATQCVPRDINKRLAYMFTNNLPTQTDGYVTYAEVEGVWTTLSNTLDGIYYDQTIGCSLDGVDGITNCEDSSPHGGASVSWRGWGNTEKETIERLLNFYDDLDAMAFHCTHDSEMNDSGGFDPLTYDVDPYPSSKGDKIGVTPRNFARCLHGLFKEKKEKRMGKCKWDTPVIKRKQPYGTKFTFRTRSEKTNNKINGWVGGKPSASGAGNSWWRGYIDSGNRGGGSENTTPTEGSPGGSTGRRRISEDDEAYTWMDSWADRVDNAAARRDGKVQDIAAAQHNRTLAIHSLEMCESKLSTNWQHLQLDQTFDGLTITSFNRRLAAVHRGEYDYTAGSPVYDQPDHPCEMEAQVVAARDAEITMLQKDIYDLEVADPDVTVVRVECPICFYATGCPSTPPGMFELDNPGKRQWCSSFVQYSRCLFYPDPLPPADDEYSEDDRERRLARQTGMWLWQRDQNMYDNLDTCELMPRTDDALHTCRCAPGYTSKFGGNPGIDNPCVALPHDHHHHGHHGEHGNEPIPEVEEPAFSRPGYTLDREYDIVTYQSEHAVPLDDREHNQEYWGYEEGHGLTNYGHLRPAFGYSDDSGVHVADDNEAYMGDQNDHEMFDNTGYYYGNEGDFFHAPYGPDNDGSNDHGRWGHHGGHGWGGDWNTGHDNDNDGHGHGYGSIFDGFPMFRGARSRGWGGSCCTIIGMAFMAMGVFLLSFYA